jgi:hypothetical protein
MMDSISCSSISGLKLPNKRDTFMNRFHLTTSVPVTGKHQFKWFDLIEMLHEWLVMSGNCPTDRGYNCYVTVLHFIYSQLKFPIRNIHKWMCQIVKRNKTWNTMVNTCNFHLHRTWIESRSGLLQPFQSNYDVASWIQFRIRVPTFTSRYQQRPCFDFGPKF